MFTIEQIQQAHSKVKSGADFPQYIRELKVLGVTHYKTFVQDGHTKFAGSHDHQLSSKPKYAEQAIANQGNKEQFIHDLKTHQQGGSDYLTFIRQCAESGVHHWYVSLEEMTCTYYDKTGNSMLIEDIPQ